MRTVNVYVPAPGAKMLASLLDPGSAIAGIELQGGDVLIYYEGGRYGQVGFDRYETRLLHAAGRLVQRYPTVARSVEAADDLVCVGTYDVETCELRIENAEPLARWIGDGELVR